MDLVRFYVIDLGGICTVIVLHWLPFRDQVSGCYQEDRPAVENDEPRTETGTLSLI